MMRPKNYRIVMILTLCFAFTFLSMLVLAPHTQYFYNLSQKEKLSQQILTSPELEKALNSSEIEEVKRLSQSNTLKQTRTWPQKVQLSAENFLSSNPLILVATLLCIVLSILLLLGRDSLVLLTWICPLLMLLSPFTAGKVKEKAPILSVNTAEMRKRLEKLDQGLRPVKEEWDRILVEHYLQELPSKDPASFSDQVNRSKLRFKTELLKSETPLYPPSLVSDALIYWLSTLGLFAWALFANFKREP